MCIEEFITKKINHLCEKHQMSKYRLAQITGVATSTLTYILRGKSTPTIQVLEKICNAFGISLAQFFSDDSTSYLTEEQKELLIKWNELDSADKRYINICIKSLKE